LSHAAGEVEFFSLNSTSITVPLCYHAFRRISAMKLSRLARQRLVIGNRKHARTRWEPQLNQAHLVTLRELTIHFGFSLPMGDLLLLEGRWYVTHTGLIRLARRNRCAGIHVRRCKSSPIVQRSAGLLRRLSTSRKLVAVLSASETRTPRTSHPLFMAPKCGLPRHAL